MNPLVTVIVPVFKAKDYIERCADSLLAQTYENVEYFFVNDCSPDNSIQLLEATIEKNPQRKPNVMIINFEQNQGHAHARNVALKQCRGEYVIQIDADDWVEKTMLEKMVQSAIENDSDIVACDFIREERDRSIYWSIKAEDLGREGLKQFKWVLEYSAHWNKLIRTALIRNNGIYCIEGTNNWVDVGQIVPLRFVAKNISVVNEALYHYNANNENSVSRHYTDKRISDMIKVAENVSSFIKAQTESEYLISTNYLCFLSKLPYLDANRNEYKKWLITFPESNDFILKYPLSKQQKILYWLAAHNFYFPLRMAKIYRSK